MTYCYLTLVTALLVICVCGTGLLFEMNNKLEQKCLKL